MKKIPSKLIIGGHTYKILVTDKLDGASGLCDYSTSTIKISKEYPKSLQESTLIHEIFHAMNSTLGDSEIGHVLLDSLAEQFYQVLSQNQLLK